jgi:hypothetical protein
LRCIDKPRENGFRDILEVLSRVCVAKKLFRVGVDIGRPPRDEIAEVRSEYRIVEFTLADFEAGLATCKDTHGFYLFNRITGDRLFFCFPDFQSAPLGKRNLAVIVLRAVVEAQNRGDLVVARSLIKWPGGWVALVGNIQRIECRGNAGIGREILGFGFGGFFGGFKKYGRSWADDLQLF